MKRNALGWFALLCLALMFFFGGITASKAQTSSTGNAANTDKKTFLESLKAKLQNSPFVILTPEDLSRIGADSQSLDPCLTASPINFGQTINGSLTPQDCRLEDFSYVDFYVFSGSQGQQVTVTMNSTAFDTYLALGNEDGTFVLEDDNSGGGTNSRIVGVLPATGLYAIAANSSLPNQFGAYTLGLNAPPPCTYLLTPTGAEVPAAGGTFTFAVNTQPNCYWSTFTPPSQFFISTSSGGTGSGTVNYSVTPNNSGATRTGTITVAGQTFTVTQPALNCTYSITPNSATVPATGFSGSFTINTPAGCYWQTQTSAYFIVATQSGVGPGAVEYIVSTNNGADRTGTITIAGQTFTVTQPGLNCTYSVSPTSINVNRAERSGSVTVTTQPGCTWSASVGQFWIYLQNSFGTGSGSFSYTMYANPYYQNRTTTISVYGLSPMNISVTQTGVPFSTRFDFDGDSKADLSFYRPATGEWSVQKSLDFTVVTTFFGAAEDIIAPADYDGDRLTDICVYRPSVGSWYRLNSSDNLFTAVQFGAAGDIPAPGDFDGDRKADTTVFRPSTGDWYRLNSTNGQFVAVTFGQQGDKPQVADFDGDGKTDVAVYRPINGGWYVLRSSDNAFFGYVFGLPTDIPTAADYDGDGRADISVYRSSLGAWYRINSSNNQFVSESYGIPEDKPVPADYDGDGAVDIGVFRPSTNMWWSVRSLYGLPTGYRFDANGGTPVPSAFGQ